MHGLNNLNITRSGHAIDGSFLPHCRSCPYKSTCWLIPKGKYRLPHAFCGTHGDAVCFFYCAKEHHYPAPSTEVKPYRRCRSKCRFIQGVRNLYWPRGQNVDVQVGKYCEQSSIDWNCKIKEWHRITLPSKYECLLSFSFLFRGVV